MEKKSHKKFQIFSNFLVDAPKGFSMSKLTLLGIFRRPIWRPKESSEVLVGAGKNWPEADQLDI